jgi:hypothetical protein
MRFLVARMCSDSMRKSAKSQGCRQCNGGQSGTDWRVKQHGVKVNVNFKVRNPEVTWRSFRGESTAKEEMQSEALTSGMPLFAILFSNL